MLDTSIRREWCRFCENLRLLRLARGYTVRQTARLLRLHTADYRRLECGELPRRVKADLILSAAQHYGVSPRDLFLPL